MSDDVEFQVWFTEPPLERFDPTDEKPSILYVVASPVIRKNVEGVLGVLSRGGVPFCFVITTTCLKCIDEPLIDLCLGEYLQELHAPNNILCDKIVPISCEISGDRQSEVVVFCPSGPKPYFLTCFAVDEI